MTKIIVNEDTLINNKIEEYFIKWMFRDIQVAIDGKANFLAALGLMEYTEILGCFITGHLFTPCHCSDNFNEAITKYFQSSYLNICIDIYDRVRCGLAHEYFIKGKSVINMNTTDEILKLSPDNLGIAYDKDKDIVYFVVKNYFRDFQQAVNKYREDIKSNTDLKKSFKDTGLLSSSPITKSGP